MSNSVMWLSLLTIVNWTVCFLIFAPVYTTSQRIKILNSRAISQPKGFKILDEVELSFFTENLGFVNDDYLQVGTTSEKIMREYLQFQREHLVIETKITNEYFKSESNLCRIYLSDPIFRNNQIYFREENENEFNMSYELKYFKFLYFQRGYEVIKVVRCNVNVFVNIHKARSYRLYFNEVLRKRQGRNSFVRGYFVFQRQETQEDNIEPLELMMYTENFSGKFPNPDDNNAESEIRDARNRRRRPKEEDSSRPSAITLIVNDERTAIGRRFFGRKAETFFLMKFYGFLTVRDNFLLADNILKVLERMRKGYEIETETPPLSIQGGELGTCEQNIMSNFYLIQNYDILIQKDAHSEEAKLVNKLVKFPITNILPEGRYRYLLRCPVTFGIERIPGIVYFLLIRYQNAQKLPQLFTFMINAESSEAVGPNMLSVVHKRVYTHSTSFNPQYLEAELHEEPTEYEDIDETRIMTVYGDTGASSSRTY